MPYWLSPNMIAKPTDQNIRLEIVKSEMFFAATLMLFLLLTNPLSKHKKPACMTKTNMAADKIHKISISNQCLLIIQLINCSSFGDI